MSEYIEIDVEESDDPDVMLLVTNLTLTDDGVERYDSADALEVGSPLAQFLSPIEGIARLVIETDHLIVTRDPEAPWHAVIEEISAAIKEFFL